MATATNVQGDRAAARPQARLPQGRARLDLATLIGLVSAFVMLGLAMLIGGTPAAFVNLPGIFIVVGGTFAVTTISFSLSEVVQAQGVMARTAFHGLPAAGEVALLMISLAETARKNGILSLQRVLENVKGERFLRRCLELLVDGTPGPDIERLMTREIHAMAQRHLKAASILRKAAETAPAMGLIGTLVGLVQMLGNLEDPSTIGPSMAVALLTTFYGAILGNMVFGPLAAKLERNSSEEAIVSQVYLLGASSIGKQENPRRLEALLNGVLPPSQRTNFFS